MGWFGLKKGEELVEGEEEEDAPAISDSVASGGRVPVSSSSGRGAAAAGRVTVQPVRSGKQVSVGGGGGGGGGIEGKEEEGQDWNFNPKVVYKKKKR